MRNIFLFIYILISDGRHYLNDADDNDDDDVDDDGNNEMIIRPLSL